MAARRQRSLQQRIDFMFNPENECCECCCCTCTFRCWAIFFLIGKIIGDIGIIIYGGWGIGASQLGYVFAYIILIVGVGMIVYIIYINKLCI